MKKPLILAAVAAVVVVALGYFLVLPMLKGKLVEAVHEDEDEPVAAAAVKKKTKRHAEPGLIYPLPDRVLNLSSSGGAPRFARIELALEFDKPAAAAHGKSAKHAKPEAHGAKEGAAPVDPALEPVAARKAQIDDALVRIIGSKTLESMTTSEGKEALKEEILDAVTEIVPTMDLLNVYIVRLVVQ